MGNVRKWEMSGNGTQHFELLQLFFDQCFDFAKV